MEKLQAALQQARQDRAEATGAQPAPGPTAPETPASPPAPQGPEARWLELTPLKVSRRQLERQRVVTQEASEAATPFDILRTKTLLMMRQNGWKRLAITSPMPSSGKSTTACNLALGISRQQDLRAILYDLDLRDPSAHKFFNTKPKTPLGKVLTGEATFAEAALRIGTNLAVGLAHRPERDPTRLLLSEDTTKVLDRIEADYQPDITIFDLPSALVNDDTRAFLKNVDCALIVIRANQTRYAQFDSCEKEVAEHTNVLGTVLNAYRYG